MAKDTTGPNPEDQNQQPPASPPPCRKLFGAASAALGTLTTTLTPSRFRQQQQREDIHDLETGLNFNHINIANNNPSDSSSSSNSSSSEESNGASSDNDTNKEEEKEEEEQEEQEVTWSRVVTMASKKKKLSYSLGGMEMSFTSTSPNQNDIHNVGIIHPRASCPVLGPSAEGKIIIALSKNQYPKFSKSESSLKDVTRLDQARGIDDNIRHYSTVLEMYDLLEIYDIVYPKDPTLQLVTIKFKKGIPVTKSLLKNFRSISITDVALSSSWYSKFDSFSDSYGTTQTFGRDMSWSLLYFREHVDPVLHNDVELRLQSFKKEEQGGITSNE